MKRISTFMIFCLLVLIAGEAFGQVRNVSGVVTSSLDNTPIEGVSIRVKGSIEAVRTDQDGRYAIGVPETSSLTLIFVHHEHDTREEVLGGRSRLDVILTHSIRFNQYGKEVNRNPVIVEEREGYLIMESVDQDYKLWFDLRVQTDGAIFLGETYNPIANGVEIRRARMAFKAELPGPWEAEIDMDFGDGTADLKDAFLVFNASSRLDIKIGHYKERFSMEQNTSSRYLTFMERPTALRTIAPSRHIGLQFHYYRPYLIAAGGIHFQPAGDAEEIENRKDNYAAGHNEGYSFTGKITGLPFYNQKDRGLHLAVSGSYRTPKTHDDIDNIRFDSRSNININRKKYIDTDRINRVSHYQLANFEFAGYYRNYKFATEYIMANVNRYEELIDGEQTGSLPSENFSGWYIMGSTMLFGGQMIYNYYQGEFTMPERGRAWGDIELGVRYDFSDFNSRPEGVMAGQGEGITIGLSYYTPKNVKFMINYGYLNFDRYANQRGRLFIGADANGALTRDPFLATEATGKGGENFHFLGFRAQISF